MATQTRGNLFPPAIVREVINLVQGTSVLAKLSAQVPVAFNGETLFTFNMPGEISIVAEGATKPHGGIQVANKSVVPIKVVYQGRVTDEFVMASDEERIEIMKAFNQGFAAKLASGLDKIFIHGKNPATGTVSENVKSYFDKDVTNTVNFAAATGGDAAIESAAALLGGYNKTGIALSNTFSSILAGETIGNTGVAKFPELAWGGAPDKLRGLKTAIGPDVGPDDYAIIGDFSKFRWGYAKNVAFSVIEYGDPDQSGVDLKASNEVMLRAEAFIGGAVIVPEAFARVLPTATEPDAEDEA